MHPSLSHGGVVLGNATSITSCAGSREQDSEESELAMLGRESNT